MTHREFVRVVFSVLLLTLSVPAFAQTPSGPRVGDPAPALSIDRWLQGEAVTTFEPGRVYLIDLWAPWCGPCLGGMAELSDLQEREAKRGLVVIGLTGDDDYGSTLEKAQKVVTTRAKDLRYRVAWDHDRETYRRWMALESGAGWPWCFVIDRQGRIAYIGHPSQLPRVIGPVLDGTWDLDSAKTVYDHRLGCLERGAMFMADYRANRFEDARRQYEAFRVFDGDAADEYAAAMFKMFRVKMGRPAAADSFVRARLDGFKPAHVGTIVQMVDMILAPDPADSPREMDLALAMSERALALADPQDAGVRAKLAEVHFRRGDIADAITAQRAAIAAARPEDRAHFSEALARYQAARH